MLRRSVFSTGLLLLFVLTPAASYAQPIPVGSEEALAWTRYLVPLPRSLAITAKVEIDPAFVAVFPTSSSDIVIDEALQELRESLGRSKTAPNPSNPLFTLTLQKGGPESMPLGSLKNSDQAYLIFPEPSGTGLRVVALGSRGVFYGAKTLMQLIAARRTSGRTKMPIITVMDWPELTDRGVWGNDSFDYCRWMGDRKMNYQEQIGARWMSSCVAYAGPKSGGYDKIHTEGPKYGIQPCTILLHLEQCAPSGLFTCYPNLRGLNTDSGAWCFTRPVGNPDAETVLAQFITSLKALPHESEVDVWMSESVKETAGCQCASCLAWPSRSQLEARAIVAGWKKAKQTSGEFGLRILTGEKGRNDLIVQELDSEPTVKIMDYNGIRTYFLYERPIVDRYIRTWSEAGRYAASVPLIGAGYCQPWTCPQFARYRIQELTDKNYSGVMAYPTPGIKWYRFNTEALAEYSWNPNGRTPREFAASWAVRQGLADPELFADWVETLGPVSWDIYGSEYPAGRTRKNKNSGPLAAALLNATLQELGELKLGAYPAPWGDIKNLESFNADVAAAIKALELANKMNIPEFKYETLVIHGYITALRALYELKSLVVGGQVAPENRQLASDYFYIYVSGIKQAKDALSKWSLVVGGTASNEAANNLLAPDISEMTQLASDLGCPISSTTTLVPACTIQEAKQAPDGTFATLANQVITSTQNGCYIQETGAAPIGLKVQTALPLATWHPELVQGTPVAVLGKMDTVGGERVLNASMVVPQTTGEQVRPFAIKTGDIGGRGFGLQAAPMEYRWTLENQQWVRRLLPAIGVHNLGVLVRIAGRVTAHGADYFYVDDGGKWNDDSGNRGIRVRCGSIDKPSIGDMVIVTGVSSTYYERGHTWRALVLPGADGLAIP